MERAAGRREPARVLRFRPLPSAGADAGAGQPAARGAELHGVRHRNDRAAAVRRATRSSPIGAVRIVNGRLLEHEVFEQLVDPRRAMSPEASRITGIETSMLENQPTIDQVLPAFRAVLRGHGARRAQRRVRHALPAPEGGGDRRAVHAAGARHAAAVGGDSSAISSRTGWRRSPSGWASTRSGGTRRSATRS